MINYISLNINADFIFADPPYFLSNGITCQNGKMIKVNKGEWDKSKGTDLNHEFNIEWIRRCQKILKPNGSMMVSSTLHAIYSIGFAMSAIKMKILNNITWQILTLSCLSIFYS